MSTGSNPGCGTVAVFVGSRDTIAATAGCDGAVITKHSCCASSTYDEYLRLPVVRSDLPTSRIPSPARNRFMTLSASPTMNSIEWNPELSKRSVIGFTRGAPVYPVTKSADAAFCPDERTAFSRESWRAVSTATSSRCAAVIVFLSSAIFGAPVSGAEAGAAAAGAA
eukprot:Amastigsp_a1043_192.p2 type:complete len:167 gc:universal Amastigsp_a1043_192:731-231(-)